MSTYELISLVLAASAVAISAVGLYFINANLRKSASANVLAASANTLTEVLMTVEMDKMLADAMEACATANATMLQLIEEKASKATIKSHQLLADQKDERFLNVLDRICSTIRRGKINEADAKRDYRVIVDQAVKLYEARLGTSSPYTNIVAVKKAWTDENTAVDPKFVSLTRVPVLHSAKEKLN